MRIAIGRVRLSVHLFQLYILNRLTFDLDFFACVSRDHISHGLKKIQAHKSRSTVKVSVCAARVYAVACC